MAGIDSEGGKKQKQNMLLDTKTLPDIYARKTIKASLRGCMFHRKSKAFPHTCQGSVGVQVNHWLDCEGCTQ